MEPMVTVYSFRHSVGKNISLGSFRRKNNG